VFVRTRGETAWQAADVALASATDRRILLPPVAAQKPVSLELYLRAYDDRGNEVLTWTEPVRPREIPLRYDPPRRGYRRTWFYAVTGGVLATAVGVTVYELTIAPPERVTGGVSGH